MPQEKEASSLRQRLFARIMSRADDESYLRYSERKKRLLSPLRGTVVEIGPGTGVNLEFYSKDLRWIGIEPNPVMREIIRRKAQAQGRELSFQDELDAGTSIEAGSIDAVVSTLVLCSIPDLPELLKTVRHILKPQGRFVFLEHQAAPRGRLLRLIQKAMPYTPWRYIADGCNPGRDLADTLRAAGFQELKIESWSQEGKGMVSAITRPHICGYAIN